MIERQQVIARLRELADRIEDMDTVELDIHRFDQEVLPGVYHQQTMQSKPRRLRLTIEVAPNSDWVEV